MSVFACTDLHGMFGLYKQIKNFIKPEDTVYCLGDCGDRGLDSWETLAAILDDPQFITIRGNHEQMLIDSIKEYLIYDGIVREKFDLLCANGGLNTFTCWVIDENRTKYYRKLKQLPYSLDYKNKDGMQIIMSHAGYTPKEKDTSHWVNDLLWGREHFIEHWPQDFDNVIILHGHTPINYLAERIMWSDIEPGALWYSDNHKVCIDNGSFTTGFCCLLDLDTFDEHIFKE